MRRLTSGRTCIGSCDRRGGHVGPGRPRWVAPLSSSMRTQSLTWTSHPWIPTCIHAHPRLRPWANMGRQMIYLVEMTATHHIMTMTYRFDTNKRTVRQLIVGPYQPTASAVGARNHRHGGACTSRMPPLSPHRDRCDAGHDQEHANDGGYGDHLTVDDQRPHDGEGEGHGRGERDVGR